MAEFLSDRWIAELDAALRAASDLASDPPLTVEQIVRAADGSEAGYQVALGPAGGRAAAAGTAPADVTLVTDPATAWALHQGTQRAQDAFARGSLKVRGRPEALAGRADLFARLEQALAPVRAGTTPIVGDPGAR